MVNNKENTLQSETAKPQSAIIAKKKVEKGN
jgi:hypothetical protein